MNNKTSCQCCGYKTVEDNWDICPVCFWEKDPLQEEFVFSRTGANQISLMEAIQNYEKFNACEERFIKYVRKAFQSEI